MDFDEHDDGDGDEEMTPLPVTSSYDAPMQPVIGLVGVGGVGGGTPKPVDSVAGSFRTPGPGNGGGGLGGGGGGGTRYRECLKNHAVGIGGHAVDGCGEFMAAGEDGSIDALRCAACGCHRNFHRKESDSPTGGGAPADPASAAAAALSPAAITAYGAAAHHQVHHHHQFSPYYRTPAGYLLHQHQHLAAMQQRPLALPSTSHTGRDDGDDMMAGLIGPMVVTPMVGMSLGSGGGPSGSGGSGSTGKKRFRTKFTQEQKDRMLAFAERLGWRIQKHDEAAVQQFCEEVCVRRNVLKVWMHNNKHTLGKKP